MLRENNRLKRRSGNALVYVLCAIAITAVITGVGLPALGTQGKKTNIRATTSDLGVIAAAITDSYEDIGAPVFDTTDIGAFKDYLEQLQSGYVGVTFDMDSVVATSNGFKVDTLSPKDAFNGDYHFRFVTKEETLNSVMVISYGSNGLSEETSYATGDYGDDIVAISSLRS